MKNIILSISLMLFIVSCSERLELSPISNKNVGNFYQTEQQFYQAIIGCYDGLQNAVLKQNYSYMMTESRSDNSWQQVDYDDGQTSRFIDNPSTQILNTAWAASYSYIARCNYVLQNLETNNVLSESVKNLFKGEALFIRALIYFDLVRFFKDVPIVDRIISIEEAYSFEKSSMETVYDFIVSDLKQAAQLLPDVKPSENKNRATSIAAKAFLGKVYVFRSGYPLNKNEWELASEELKSVLDVVETTGFFSSYSDIFSYTNEGKDQAVFSIGCKSGAEGEGNPFPTRNAPNGINPGTDPLMIPFGGSPMQLFLDDYILGSIFDEPNDKRYYYSVQTKWIEKSKDTVTNWPFCSKYKNGPIAAASDWDIDWIMLRYTDVYMLYGEAQYHLGNKEPALDILNDVRERAGLEQLTIEDIDSEEKFVDALLKERRKEFCFENQRWFDLVRTDRAFDLMKQFLNHYGSGENLKSKDQYFYPVPQRETDVSGLI